MYDLQLADLSAVVKKHWGLIVACGLGTTALVLLVTLALVPREWATSTTVIIGNTQGTTSTLASLLSGIGGSALPGLPSVTGRGPSTDLYETLLRSWETNRQVVQQCRLQEFFAVDSEPQAVSRLLRVTAVENKPPLAVIVRVRLPGTPRGLGLQPPADLEVRQLTVAVLNAYLSILQQRLGAMRISSAKSQRMFLEEQRPKARDDLYKAQEALAKWQAQHHIPAPPKAGEVLAGQLATIQSALTEAEINAAMYARSEQRARDLLKQQPEMVKVSQAETQNPQIAALTKTLSEVEQELAEQQTFYRKTEEHPDVQRLLIKRKELQEQLAAAYEKAMQVTAITTGHNQVYDEILQQLLTAQVQRAAHGAKAAGLRRALAEGRRLVESLSWQSLEYAKLYEDVQIRQAIYETISKQYEAARLSEKAEEPTFYVVDPPVLPWKKARPSTIMNGLLGLIFGLVVGTLWVCLRQGPRLAVSTAESDSNTEPQPSV